MGEQWLALVKNGMDVCDMTGEKIGTVREVYARVGGAARPEVDQSRRAELAAGAGPYVEVATGFLGLVQPAADESPIRRVAWRLRRSSSFRLRGSRTGDSFLARGT